MQSSWIPAIRSIIHIIDGQPLVGSPYISVLTIINIIPTIAIKNSTIPEILAITSGAVENATIPSIA